MSDSELPFVEVQLSSYEVKSGDVPFSLRGRLRKSIQFWREIDAPRFILDTIEFGYKLPLLQIPPPFVATNNNSALQESEFVESAISELLSLECITEVFAAPAGINPLSVSIQKSGKKRLILDLRHVNQGPVVQKPVNVNLRLKINKGVLFSTPKCCSRLIFGKTLH